MSKVKNPRKLSRKESERAKTKTVSKVWAALPGAPASVEAAQGILDTSPSPRVHGVLLFHGDCKPGTAGGAPGLGRRPRFHGAGGGGAL